MRENVGDVWIMPVLLLLFCNTKTIFHTVLLCFITNSQHSKSADLCQGIAVPPIIQFNLNAFLECLRTCARKARWCPCAAAGEREREKARVWGSSINLLIRIFLCFNQRVCRLVNRGIQLVLTQSKTRRYSTYHTGVRITLLWRSWFKWWNGKETNCKQWHIPMTSPATCP